MPATIRGRARPSAPKPKADAYVGMLFLSLIALITGAVFLYLDYSQYGERKLSPPPDRPTAVVPKAAPAP